MANSGIKHIDVGTELTKVEWEDEASHELVGGTSFPASPVEKQLYYRTDEHKWYIYNGSAWVECGTQGHQDLTTGVHGVGSNYIAQAPAASHLVRTFTKGWTSSKRLKGDGVNTDPIEFDEILTLTFIIDGGGSAITTGQKGHLEIPFACTINQVTMMADQTGSIVVDIWKDTYANFPPTDADSITASAPPTISSAQKSKNATLVGWTKSIAAGHILAFNVDSCTTITRVTISLKVIKT